MQKKASKGSGAGAAKDKSAAVKAVKSTGAGKKAKGKAKRASLGQGTGKKTKKLVVVKPPQAGQPNVVTVRQTKPMVREPVPMRRAKLDGDMSWAHDMFAHHGKETSEGPRAPSRQGTKLFISNLAWKVTNQDVRELFESVGPLIAARVHYMPSGRSKGTAEAIFKLRKDAVAAKARYHDVALDGRPMNIEIIEQAATSTPNRTLKSGLTLGVPKAASVPAKGRVGVRSRVERMQMG